MTTHEISRVELQSKIESHTALVLLEALPEPYFRQGHLPGARHMPHDHVRELAPTLAPDRDAEIVVYCASATCQNSHVAARTLASMGYAKVRVFAGGKAEWESAGLALVPEPA